MRIPLPSRSEPAPTPQEQESTTDQAAGPCGAGGAGADDRGAGAAEDRRRRLEGLASSLIVPVSWLVAAGLLAGAPDLVAGHLGVGVWALSVLAVPVVHTLTQVVRWSQRSSTKRETRRRAKASLPSLMSRCSGWGDAFLWRDDTRWRVAQWVATAGCLVACLAGATPLDALPWPAWQVGCAAGGPAVWWLVVGGRQWYLTRLRRQVASMVWSIALTTLKYPKSQGTMLSTTQWLDLTTPWRAVRVSEWDTSEQGVPTVPRVFTVTAPPSLSVTDERAWTEFERNVNAKLPRPTGWHVQRAANGTGATVSPAHYPTSAVWDGEVDGRDVMGYLLGESLDEQGTPQRLTLTNPANHALFTGGTGAGKTSVVEIIMAQTVLKTMPWDASLHGQVHVIDPKGPLAGRWAGRPGVMVSRGDREGKSPYGDEISGPQVMAAHCDLIEEEHQRRAEILSRYPNAGNWHDLPEDVKRDEHLAPMIVVIDEYLDFTGGEKARGAEAEKIEADNDARAHVTYLTTWWARKARNVGIHVFVVLQEAKMTEIGSQLKRQAMVRVIMGQMDDTSYQGMFDTPDVPVLPTTRKVTDPVTGVVEDKPIPGRGLIQTATKGRISRFQAYWFGGPQNVDSLDKWLPRDPTPGAGVFNGDAARVVMAAMTDADGDGIPDAWQNHPRGEQEGRGALFPAAQDGAAPRRAQCAWPGCDNLSTVTCPRDGKGYCKAHTGPSPDPGEAGRFGQAYIDSHPLTVAGAGDLYRQVHELATQAGLAASWAPVADPSGVMTGQVQVLVSTPEGKMVAQVVAGADQVQARTAIERAGVFGLDASLAAVAAAITARSGK